MSSLCGRFCHLRGVNVKPGILVAFLGVCSVRFPQRRAQRSPAFAKVTAWLRTENFAAPACCRVRSSLAEFSAGCNELATARAAARWHLTQTLYNIRVYHFALSFTAEYAEDLNQENRNAGNPVPFFISFFLIRYLPFLVSFLFLILNLDL